MEVKKNKLLEIVIILMIKVYKKNYKRLELIYLSWKSSLVEAKLQKTIIKSQMLWQNVNNVINPSAQLQNLPNLKHVCFVVINAT